MNSEMELEPSNGFTPQIDRRRPIPVPPPVLLVTVEDARLPGSIGWERELDEFYVGILQFEKEGRPVLRHVLGETRGVRSFSDPSKSETELPSSSQSSLPGPGTVITYKAENFRLIFDLVEGPVQRNDLRMLGIIVKLLSATMQKFHDAEIEFECERGLVAGEERLVLMDPVGNWLRITESKPVM